MTGSARAILAQAVAHNIPGLPGPNLLAAEIIAAIEQAGYSIEKVIHPDPPQAQCAFSIIELLELVQSLLRSQIREERINSIEELYGFLREVDTHLALLSAARQQEAQDDG